MKKKISKRLNLDLKEIELSVPYKQIYLRHCIVTQGVHSCDHTYCITCKF